MMLFIDKNFVARFPKVVCTLIGIVCVLLSILFVPHKYKEQYIEGTINEYIEEIRHGGFGKGGGTYHHEFYYVLIDNIKIGLPVYEDEKYKGRKTYWKEKLEGKYAKIYYSKRSNCIRHIELEDGSYSYHDPHDISYYDIGWFPFCITAPIALFCIFVLLRYFYLLTFASDERRKLVFGNKNGDLN